MQDITEQQELAQEISDAISKPVGLGEQFDEVGRRGHLLQIHRDASGFGLLQTGKGSRTSLTSQSGARCVGTIRDSSKRFRDASAVCR